MIIKLYSYFKRDIYGGVKCRNCQKRIHSNEIVDIQVKKTVLGMYVVNVAYVCERCTITHIEKVLVSKWRADRDTVEFYVKEYFEFSK